MTQAVIANPPALAPVITGAPIITAPPANLAEPTMEELAALVPEPEAESLAPYEQPGAEPPVEGAEPVAATEPVVEPEVAAAPEAPAEADAALDRVAAAAKRAREGSRRYKETQARVAETEARAQRASQEAEQHRREAAAAREREAEYQKDPYKALKDRGMTDVQLAERAMRENTPEAVTARLEQQLGEERAARIALEKRIEGERQNAVMESRQRQAETELVTVARDGDAFPTLASAKPQTQLWAARQALAQINANGHVTSHFTMSQIAEAANRWLSSHIESLGVKPGTAAAPVVPEPGVVAKAKPSGETLTNKLAQTRTVAPATWDSLTDEQQIAHIAAGLPEPAG